MIAIFLAVFFSACTTPRNTGYFTTIQKDTTIKGFISNDFETVIRKGDNLGITISSLSPEENAKFNSAGLIVTEKGTVPTYMVQPDGTIKLYRFGNVKIEGLTRRQFAAKLQQDLLPFLKEPIVNVTYLNHKVTVLGEVGNPMVINLAEEQLPVIDAIIMSGDVNENASRNRIMIIRENGTEKQVKHINLEDESIFTSPWYYLKPNDIVYVMPDTQRLASDEKRRRLQTNLSLAASGLALIVIVVDRIIR